MTLNEVVHELRDEKESLNETNDSLRADLRTRDEDLGALRIQLADAQRKADGLIRINLAHSQKHQCESLYAQGQIHGAAECLLQILNAANEDVRANKLIMDWLSGEFRCRALDREFNCCHQSLYTDLSRHWRELETKHRTQGNKTKQLQLTLLRCRSVP